MGNDIPKTIRINYSVSVRSFLIFGGNVLVFPLKDTCSCTCRNE